MSTLNEIQARAAKASPGPWSLAHPRPDGRNLVERRGYDLYGGEVSEMVIVDTNPSDAEFIAHARTDVPKLVNALQRAEAVAIMFEKGVFGADGIAAAKTLRHVIAEALA